MSKKLMVLLMIFALVVSVFSACGKEPEQADTKSPTEAPEPSTTEGSDDAAVENSDETSGSDELIPVTFRLNYTATGLHAPFYLALERGYYEEVGLDVTIGEGTGSGTTAKLVGMGTDMLGLVDSASVASAVTNAIPIRVVCPVYAVNGFGVITLEGNGINIPKDLEGKRVGITTGDGPSNLFPAIAGANGVDLDNVTLVSMDKNSKITALINGQVDAILGGADNEAIQIENMDTDKEVKILRYSDFGAPTVGLSIIASNDAIKNNPDIIEKFISASMRGWNDAREEKEEAVEVIQKYIPTLDHDIALAGLEVALSSLFNDNSNTLGDVSPEDWDFSVQLLINYMSVDSSFPATAYYTYDCLPDDLPAR